MFLYKEDKIEDKTRKKKKKTCCRKFEEDNE